MPTNNDQYDPKDKLKRNSAPDQTRTRVVNKDGARGEVIYTTTKDKKAK